MSQSTEYEPAPNRRGRAAPSGLAWRVGVVAIATWVAGTALWAGGVVNWPQLSGDEPHYLVLAQSLWNDGDLELRDNYRDRDYRKFLGPEAWLAAHQKSGVSAKTTYSFHAPGLGVLLAPVYGIFAGSSPDEVKAGARVAMAIWGSVLAVALWLMLQRIAGSRAAFGGTAFVVLTTPFLFNLPALFPDLPAAALSALGYETMRRSHNRPAHLLLAGLLLAPLPWLHYKFLTLVATVIAVGLWQLARPEDTQTRSARPSYSAAGDALSASKRSPGWARGTVALLAAPALGVLSFAGYTWVAFGSLSPMAMAPMSAPIHASGLWAYLSDPGGFLRTAIGLFLDQKDGLFFIAPHYALGILGAAWLAREQRPELLRLGLVFGAYWLPVALSQNVGLWSPPGRWLVAGLWPLAVCCALGLMVPVSGRPLRWFRGAAAGFGVAVTLLYLSNPALAFVDAANTRSLLLQQYGGPGLEPWRWFPVWFRYDEPQWAVTITWLFLVLAGGTWVWRSARWQAPARAAAGTDEASAKPHMKQRRRLPHPCAQRAFAGALLFVGSLALFHRVVVPVPGGEALQSRTYGRVRVHVTNYPRRPIVLTPDVVWLGGSEQLVVTLSTRRPIRWIKLALSSRPGAARDGTPATARVCVEGACKETELRPDERLLRLTPGDGKQWGGRVYYKLRAAGLPPSEAFEARLRIVDFRTRRRE